MCFLQASSSSGLQGWMGTYSDILASSDLFGTHLVTLFNTTLETVQNVNGFYMPLPFPSLRRGVQDPGGPREVPHVEGH